MKATITFDFSELFFHRNDIWRDEHKCTDVVEVDWLMVDEFSRGDEVEILKTIEDDKFSGGIGYVIFNPKNNASTVVASHMLNIKDH